jgi:hypothetical protein
MRGGGEEGMRKKAGLRSKACTVPTLDSRLPTPDSRLPITPVPFDIPRPLSYHGARPQPGFLTRSRSETAQRAVDARKTTEAAAGLVMHHVEVDDRV